MFSGNSVVLQNHRRACQIFHDDINVPSIEEISSGYASGNAWNAERRARLFAAVAKGAVLLIELQNFWFFVPRARWEGVNLRIDVTAHKDEVEPAVIVRVEENRSPFHIRQRRQRHSGLVRNIGE